jgi:hypothetical protein
MPKSLAQKSKIIVQWYWLRFEKHFDGLLRGMQQEGNIEIQGVHVKSRGETGTPACISSSNLFLTIYAIG